LPAHDLSLVYRAINLNLNHNRFIPLWSPRFHMLHRTQCHSSSYHRVHLVSPAGCEARRSSAVTGIRCFRAKGGP
jgi:hypothetical protein